MFAEQVIIVYYRLHQCFIRCNKGSIEMAAASNESLYFAFISGDLDRMKAAIETAQELDLTWKDDILHLACYNNRGDILELLFERGVDVNSARNTDAWTLLHVAADLGFPEMVGVLLKFQANCSARTHYFDFTPLHVAAIASQNDVVTVLLEHGVDVNICTNSGQSALHLATKEGHTETVKVLLDFDADVDCVTGHGNGPLHIAAEQDQVEIAELLLQKGANVDAKNDSGWCPLHGAADLGSVPLTELLLSYEANVNAWTTFVLDRTPLMLAAHQGHADVVLTLLQHGAEVNLTTQYGESALHFAIIQLHLPVIKLLVDHNADVDSATHLHNSPIHFAVKAKDIEVLRCLLEAGAVVDTASKSQLCLGLATDFADIPLLELVLQQGASINTHLSVCGQTALHRAVRKGRKELVQVLLEKGANANAVTSDCGETPIHVAAYGEAENEDIMKMLIVHGADVDAIFEQYCRTALNIVMENGHEGCTKLLLENGADVAGMTNDGETPLHIAAREGFREGVELLLHYDVSRTIATRDRDGDMPHHKTVYGDHQMALHVLLEHGCPLNAEDGAGETALEHAVTAHSIGCALLLLIHGALYDEVLLGFILVYKRDTLMHVLDLFLQSGSTQEPSLENVYSTLDSRCENQKAFGQEVKQRVKTSISLKMLARTSIRAHLTDCIENHSIVAAIKMLPLPKALKQYLLLRDHSHLIGDEVCTKLYSGL